MPVTILFEGDANYQPSSDRLPQICVCTANVSSWPKALKLLVATDPKLPGCLYSPSGTLGL